MNIIVHYPKSKADIEVLRKNVAEVHAKAVVSYLSKLSLTKEQTDSVINGMCLKVKQG